MTSNLRIALGYALTGVELLSITEAKVRGIPDIGDVAELLAKGSWTTERILAHARTTVEAGGIWPHPIPNNVLTELGAARFYSALAELRRRLGVWTTVPLPPSQRTQLSADERRLMAEMPPHHVG